MSNQLNKKLLPFRSVYEGDRVNLYSLDQVAEAGTFVKVSRGDANDIQGIVADSFGADFDRVNSPRWGVKNKLTVTTSGDTKYNVLGVTEMDVRETDENGIPLKFYPQKATELNAVISGHSVPVITKGTLTLGTGAYTVTGAPVYGATQAGIGWVIVPSNTQDGIVDAVPATVLTASPVLATEYSHQQVLGKVIMTGTEYGGSITVQYGI